MKTETEKNCETPGVCNNSTDAVEYWRKNAVRAAASVAESLFVLCLDSDRHFTGCHQITTKVFNSPALLADEILSASFVQGVEEIIFLHNRPGSEPEADAVSKARARALILAGRPKQCLLDYIIVGKANDKFIKGFFGLAHFRKSFNSENPWPPKAKQQRQPREADSKEGKKQ